MRFGWSRSKRFLAGRRPSRGFLRLTLFGLASVLVLGLVLGGAVDALGCPNCKDALGGSDPDSQALARGYFYSIILMLAMPFTLAGTFGCYVWREMRRQRREQAPDQGLR
jgi:Na+-driven multidrug efflux pump